jgi:lipopolysaccharide heptosyltransferase I
MNTPARILIIRLSSLGDILHTLPAFADLRAAFPEAMIDWLVAKHCRDILSAVPGIDAVHVFDKSRALHPGGRDAVWSLVRRLRHREYDIAIDFQGLIKTALLCRLSGARTRFGFSRELAREFPAHWFYHRALARPENQAHVLRLNRMLAEMAGAEPSQAPIGLQAPPPDQQMVETFLDHARLTNFVVINPGGGWDTKRWNAERYGALAKRIMTELGLPVVVTIGPGEDSYYRAIKEHSGENAPYLFAGSFLQLIPLLKKSRLFIGGDTGPFHLACALETPVVGIFGPTSPIRNGPWREGDEVVWHKLACSDCYGRTCPKGNECMEIAADEVFAAAVRRLARVNHEGL